MNTLVVLWGFSFKILSENSLHFMGIRVFIVGYVRNVKSHFFAKQGFLVTHSWLGQVLSFSCEIIDWPDYPFYSIVLQLSWPFNFLHASHMWHFGESSVVKMLLIAHTLEFFTLSYTQPLHDSHLNTWYLIAELQTNSARNKANTWLNKFNLIVVVVFHLWVSLMMGLGLRRCGFCWIFLCFWDVVWDPWVDWVLYIFCVCEPLFVGMNSNPISPFFGILLRFGQAFFKGRWHRSCGGGISWSRWWRIWFHRWWCMGLVARVAGIGLA